MGLLKAFEKAAPAAILGILCACGTEPKETVMPEVLERSVVEAGANGGTYTVALTDGVGLPLVCLAEEGEADGTAWCSAAAEGNVLSVRVQPNPTDRVRTAGISVMRGGEPFAGIAVVQARASLSVENTLVEADAAGFEATAVMKVECVTEWEASCDSEWASASRSGEWLVLGIEPNPAPEGRSAEVALKSGNIERRVAVVQSGCTLTLHCDAQVEMSAAESVLSIAVETPAGWSVRNNAYWLNVKTESSRLILRAEKNSGDPRSTEVTVTAGELSRRLTVVQADIYRSLVGTWVMSGLSATEGQTVLGSVTLEPKEEGVSFALNGYGQDFLRMATYAPFTLAYDRAAAALTVTTGEEVGTFYFEGFPDETGMAVVKTVLVTYDGEEFGLDTAPGQTVTGGWNDALDEIAFESDRGLYYGMWYYTTGEWAGVGCSQRMVNLKLTRDAGGETPRSLTAREGTNGFSGL